MTNILYKWIDNGDGVFPTYTCPVCREVSEDDYPFCPVCKQELADSSSAIYNPVLP